MKKILLYSAFLLATIGFIVSCQKEQAPQQDGQENLALEQSTGSEYVVNTTSAEQDGQITGRTCCATTFLNYSPYQGNQLLANFEIYNASSIKYSRYLFEVIDATTGIVYFSFVDAATGLPCGLTNRGVNITSIVSGPLLNCRRSYAVRLKIQQYSNIVPPNGSPWQTCASATSTPITLGTQLCD